MSGIPKIKNVRASNDYHLIVKFDNDSIKEYNCRQLLHRLEFKPLLNKAFFCSVKVDNGGYGVSWNDDIDISEYELWVNGKEINVRISDTRP
jgi:hypothetical protein